MDEEDNSEISKGNEKKHTKKIALIIIIIVILVAFTYVFYKGNSEHAENTLYSLTEQMNAGNWEGVLDNTYWKYTSEYNNRLSEMEEMGEQLATLDYYNVEVELSNVRYYDELSNNEKESMQEIVDEIESKTNKNVDTFCLVTYRIIMTENTDQIKKIRKDVYVKMSGEWLGGKKYDEYPVEVDYEVVTAQGEEAGLIGYDVDIEVKNTHTVPGRFDVSMKIIYTNGQEYESEMGVVVPYVGSADYTEDDVQYGSVTAIIGPGETKVFYFPMLMPEGFEFEHGVYRIESRIP